MPYWRLYYHLVWATKERRPLITPEMQNRAYAVLAAKAQVLGAIVHAIGGTEDHLHLAVSVPPARSLVDFVGQLKDCSSHFINHELGQAFAWQAEYGAVSFGERQLPKVVAYIHSQQERHRAHDLIPALERVAERGETA